MRYLHECGWVRRSCPEHVLIERVITFALLLGWSARIWPPAHAPADRTNWRECIPQRLAGKRLTSSHRCSWRCVGCVTAALLRTAHRVAGNPVSGSVDVQIVTAAQSDFRPQSLFRSTYSMNIGARMGCVAISTRTYGLAGVTAARSVELVHYADRVPTAR